MPCRVEFWAGCAFINFDNDAPGLLESLGPVVDRPRGLDHGAWVPLKVMYPGADVPVVQLSLPTDRADVLFAMGQRLAALREEGVLVIGSGFMTHGLPFITPAMVEGKVPGWSRDFDSWAWDAIVAFYARHETARRGDRGRRRQRCRARSSGAGVLRAALRDRTSRQGQQLRRGGALLAPQRLAHLERVVEQSTARVLARGGPSDRNHGAPPAAGRLVELNHVVRAGMGIAIAVHSRVK